MNPLLCLLACFAGWMNRHQQAVIGYLQEEVRDRDHAAFARPVPSRGEPDHARCE